jgi:P pilus assembly chaperone PapD
VQKGSDVKLTSVTARRAGAVAGALALAGGGVALLAHATPAGSKAAAGGLSLSPTIIEQTAQAGAGGTVVVANHSAHTLAVTVAARPWRQSRSGDAVPNRRKTLSDVKLSDTSFSLKPKAQRTITVALPSSGDLYGALEVIGLPPNADAKKGIVTGYRLIGSLRLDPATPVLKLSTGKVKTSGHGSARQLVLPVTNRGNTVQPVSGDVDLKGPLGTRSTHIGSVRILPHKTVNVSLGRTRGLTAGRYRASIELDQGDLVAKVKRSVRIKR